MWDDINNEQAHPRVLMGCNEVGDVSKCYFWIYVAMRCHMCSMKFMYCLTAGQGNILMSTFSRCMMDLPLCRLALSSCMIKLMPKNRFYVCTPLCKYVDHGVYFNTSLHFYRTLSACTFYTLFMLHVEVWYVRVPRSLYWHYQFYNHVLRHFRNVLPK